MSGQAIVRPAVVWSWSSAALAALYGLPAAAVAFGDVPTALALGVGVLPAAAVGLLPTRRARWSILVVGSMAGLSLFLGSVLAETPLLAVPAIVALAVAAAWLAGRARLGMLMLSLSLPLVGAGLSFDSTTSGAGLALAMIAGSAFACAVSMFLPERSAGSPPSAPPPTVGYGLRLGLAGATAAAIGFALDLDHVGWAACAAMIVMRPAAEMQRLRSVGRVVSVVVGAFAGGVFAQLVTEPVGYALAIPTDLAGVGGTRGSRWYVLSAFSTFLVFQLLLFGQATRAESRFVERVVETVLGVGLAYVYGLALPALFRRRSKADETEEHLRGLGDVE